MRRKLILFISVLILSCPYTLANNNPDLPKLPVAENIESESTEGKEKSFWSKLKGFFGFGEEENDNLKSQDVVGEENGSTHSLKDNMSLEEQDNSDEISNPIPPLGATEDGPKASDSDILELPSVPEDDSEKLAIPEGFDDDVENDNSLIAQKPIEDINSSESLSIPEGFGEEMDNSMDSSKEEKAVEFSELPPQGEVKDKETMVDVKLPEGFDEEIDDEPTSESSDSTETLSTEEENQQEVSEVDQEENTYHDGTEAQSKMDTNAKQDQDNAKIDSTDKEVISESDDNLKLELPSMENQDTAVELTDNNLPVPIYAGKEDEKQDEESVISKYKKELQAKRTQPEERQKIAAEELSPKENEAMLGFSAINSADLDSVQLEFVNNEAQVLILPADDVVLGQLTEEARLAAMDLRTYLKIFWDNYNRLKREPKRLELERFIDNYDENFNEEDNLYYEDTANYSLKEAFASIDRGDTYSLIALLNNYSILQLSGKGQNNLLHEASYVGNYPAARLLVLKGIDLFARNNSNHTALDIAKLFRHDNIVQMLKSAGLNGS